MQVSQIPQEQLNINPDGISELIHYFGWTIYCWTGWKGTSGVAGYDSDEPCIVCGKGFSKGDRLKLDQATPYRHWSCVHPPEYKDRHMAQWVASKWDGTKWRHAEVNVDNLQVGKLLGGEYRKGDSFNVSMDGEFITEDTPQYQKDMLKEAGLSRMYLVIDELNAEDLRRRI